MIVAVCRERFKHKHDFDSVDRVKQFNPPSLYRAMDIMKHAAGYEMKAAQILTIFLHSSKT